MSTIFKLQQNTLTPNLKAFIQSTKGKHRSESHYKEDIDNKITTMLSSKINSAIVIMAEIKSFNPAMYDAVVKPLDLLLQAYVKLTIKYISGEYSVNTYISKLNILTTSLKNYQPNEAGYFIKPEKTGRINRLTVHTNVKLYNAFNMYNKSFATLLLIEINDIIVNKNLIVQQVETKAG